MKKLFIRFPLNNKARLAQWMEIDELKSINVTRAKRICSAHFTSESFEEHCTVKRLKKNAVPSIFGDAVQVYYSYTLLLTSQYIQSVKRKYKLTE